MNVTTDATTILYIDDDAVNRSLVNRLLTGYHFRVLEAENGLQGISIAKEEHPHLILMDINMPGLDGHETTTRMRSIAALKQTPIVAVTARTTKGEREMALTAGCDGYIPKPIDVDNFPYQVISYLDGQKETISQDERQLYLGRYSRKLVERLEEKIVELEEVNKKLQRIDTVKSDFITIAAHELRTPITLIYGYAHLLQLAADDRSEAPPEEGSVYDLANRIFNAVCRLNETVNHILNISLIQAKQMQLDCQPVALIDVINTTLREINRTKHDRLLTIGVDDSLSSLPPIVGDPQRLQQVFWNLLSNAIKFTPDGGSILVKGWDIDSPSTQEKNSIAETDTWPPYWPPKLAQTGGVVVAVEDSGIGIAPAEQSEIFDNFYIVGKTRYHSSSKTDFGGGGLGLGLPIAKGIILAHGGQIWVKSPGQDAETCPGSTFYVFLPFNDQP
jgi:signal transduction histidine kinase